MRILLLIQLPFLLLFGASTKSKAQQWCSEGATWEYENAYVIKWLIKYEYAGDTLIEGNNANILERYVRTYFFGPPGSNPYASPPGLSGKEYTLYRNDSLFYWKHDEFKLLIDYGASVGDTWELELFNPNNDSLCGYETRTVDSVGIEVVNGIEMKWVAFSSDNGDRAKAYERFGPINNFIFPHLFNCIEELQEVPLTIFRCYSDNEIGEIISESFNSPISNLMVQQDIPCGLFETVSVEEISDIKKIAVYPNPASNFIYIENLDLIQTECTITDMLGKEIMKIDLNYSVNQIDFNLMSGLYT